MSQLLPGSRPASVTLPNGDEFQGECQLFEILDLRDLRSSFDGTFATAEAVPIDNAEWLDIPAFGRFKIISAGYSISTGASERTELHVLVRRIDERDS